MTRGQPWFLPWPLSSSLPGPLPGPPPGPLPGLLPPPSLPPGFGGPGGPLGFCPGGAANSQGGVLGDDPMYMGQELP